MPTNYRDHLDEIFDAIIEHRKYEPINEINNGQIDSDMSIDNEVLFEDNAVLDNFQPCWHFDGSSKEYDELTLGKEQQSQEELDLRSLSINDEQIEVSNTSTIDAKFNSKSENNNLWKYIAFTGLAASVFMSVIIANLLWNAKGKEIAKKDFEVLKGTSQVNEVSVRGTDFLANLNVKSLKDGFATIIIISEKSTIVNPEFHEKDFAVSNSGVAKYSGLVVKKGTRILVVISKQPSQATIRNELAEFENKGVRLDFDKVKEIVSATLQNKGFEWVEYSEAAINIP
jgi:hypothetical protein